MDDDALRIYSLFKLSNGVTVIACDRPVIECSWSNQKVRIVSDGGEQRQKLVISGQRSMLRQTNHLDQIAIETPMHVLLSTEEAESGHWFIVSGW